MTSLRNPDSHQLSQPGRDELAAWLRLGLARSIGPVTALALLRAFGTPDRIFTAGSSAIAAVVGSERAAWLIGNQPELDESVARSLAWADQPGNHLLTLADAAYPKSLLELPDPPVLLFVQGEPSVLQRPSIAIVGSRQASRSGIDNAGAFALHLAGIGLCVVSGLARGIDAAAHQGAIDAGGTTVAVLGTGIDRIYPASNKSLAGQMTDAGAVISEFPLGSGPLKAHFPRRNRLIAGLSIGVLVVEAARRSGSLITARLAGDYGRDVFAIPGSIHSPLARGCHQLIRDGARLVETAEDIIGELSAETLLSAARQIPPVSSSGTPSTTRSAHQNAPDELLEAIGWEPVNQDSLAAEGCYPAGELEQRLLELELGGWLERLPDGRLQRLRN